MSATSIILAPGAFRLALAFAVVVNHVTVAPIGLSAVLIFFMLSGYWVSDLWAKTTGPNRLATFYLGRALRIWPLYLAVLIVCAALARRVPTFSEVALFGVASQPFPRLIGTEWSLDIEVQFYALLPLLALMARRFDRTATIALITAATLIGWWVEVSWGLVTIAKFLPAFAAGMAIQHFGWRPSEQWAACSLLAFVLATIGHVTVWTLYPAQMHHAFGGWDHHALAALWIAPLLPYAAASITARSSPQDRTLGDLSYPLYLAHLPVLLTLQQVYDWRSGPGVVVLLALITVVTAVLWYAIDRPAERLRKVIMRRQSQRALQAVAARN